LKLLRALKLSYDIEQPSIEEKEKLLNVSIKQRILRVHVRRIIGGELGIVDRHTITGWLNQLISIGALSPNPTSEYVNKGLYKRPKFMPNANTKYFIEIETIETMITALEKELNTPHTTTLDLFNDNNFSSGRDHGSSSPKTQLVERS
jgi:hypothetical protein